MSIDVCSLKHLFSRSSPKVVDWTWMVRQPSGLVFHIMLGGSEDGAFSGDPK